MLASTPAPLDRDLAGPAQVAYPLFDPSRHPDRNELTCPMQARKAPAVAAIGLYLVTWGSRDERRRDHLGGHAHSREEAVQLVACRPGLVTGAKLTRIGKA